jgi:hypothetical protein
MKMASNGISTPRKIEVGLEGDVLDIAVWVEDENGLWVIAGVGITPIVEEFIPVELIIFLRM